MLQWRVLKGFNGTTSNDILYTFIRCQKKNNPTLSRFENRPEIYLNTINSDNTSEGAQSLGYIACTGVDNDFGNHYLDAGMFVMDYDSPSDRWEWFGENNDTSCGLLRLTESGYTTVRLHSEDILKLYAYYKIQLKSTNNIHIWGNSQLTLYNGSITNSLDIISNGYANIYSRSGYGIYFNSTTSPDPVTPGGVTKLLRVVYNNSSDAQVNINYERIYANVPINASYFNALSDRRSKDNINQITTPVLDIINKIPVYAFNYKNKNHDRSIGLMAQDLVNINLDNFNFVDNPNATGQDDDFMQIHESKLVYVLWKAVQELSAEVTFLKQQLNK